MYLSSASSLDLPSDSYNYSLFHDSINHTCADVWYSLINNQYSTNIINKYATSWWRDFTNCLPLDTEALEQNVAGWAKMSAEGIQRDHFSCKEDKQEKPDPIYSAFGRVRNGFYVSNDGHVFRSKVEVCIII